MKAIEITAFGGPEVLKPCQRPIPEPQENEVLLRVAYAGVNRPDILQRTGHYPPPQGASDLPGLEVSGVVEKIGGGVTRVKTGDKVCALLPGGGYAQYAIASADLCLPVPDELPMDQAAALPETLFTTWKNLAGLARLKPGETALIHGGSSGIGTIAIQLAAFLGAKVYAVAGSPEKCALCEKLGAIKAYNRHTEKYDDIRPDVVLSMVGGDSVATDIALMNHGGRHVSIAFLAGKTAQVDISQVMRKNLTLTGSTLRDRPLSEKTALARGIEGYVWQAVIEGRIRPVISKTFPLDLAAEAHALLEANETGGKIVLQAS